jgi:hypothetical protein
MLKFFQLSRLVILIFVSSASEFTNEQVAGKTYPVVTLPLVIEPSSKRSTKGTKLFYTS